MTGLTDAVGVAPGSGHTCAVRVNGLVTCWGSNFNGQLGNGFTDSGAHVFPAGVPDLDEVVAVASGGNHSCALRTNGTVRCWGANFSGQIGDGTISLFDSRPSPTAVNGLGAVVVLALGDEHSCARRTDGDVRCWGRDDNRQLGDGFTTNQPTQITVADHFSGTPTTGFVPTPLLDVEGLAAGETHSCALQVDEQKFAVGARTISDNWAARLPRHFLS